MPRIRGKFYARTRTPSHFISLTGKRDCAQTESENFLAMRFLVMFGVMSATGRVALIAGVYVGGTLENPSQVELDELFQLIHVYILASLQKKK